MSKMLSSWKEIAHFFGKGVRTVQRWEKTLDLPIHRPPGAPSNVVLARTSDLEEWMHRGPVTRALDEEQHNTAPVDLGRLEHEVSLLAEFSGTAAPQTSAAVGVNERIGLLADSIHHARVKLVSSKNSVRAA